MTCFEALAPIKLLVVVKHGLQVSIRTSFDLVSSQHDKNEKNRPQDLPRNRFLSYFNLGNQLGHGNKSIIIDIFFHF